MNEGREEEEERSIQVRRRFHEEEGGETRWIRKQQRGGYR